MMTATKKKILVWVVILSILCMIPNLSVRSFAVQGQAVKDEKLIQEVATVPPLFNYSALALKYIPEEASGISVSGTIKELKSLREI